MQFDPPKNKGGGKWNRRWNKMPQLQILLFLKSPFWGMHCSFYWIHTTREEAFCSLLPDIALIWGQVFLRNGYISNSTFTKIKLSLRAYSKLVLKAILEGALLLYWYILTLQIWKILYLKFELWIGKASIFCKCTI